MHKINRLDDLAAVNWGDAAQNNQGCIKRGYQWSGSVEPHLPLEYAVFVRAVRRTDYIIHEDLMDAISTAFSNFSMNSTPSCDLPFHKR